MRDMVNRDPEEPLLSEEEPLLIEEETPPKRGFYTIFKNFMEWVGVMGDFGGPAAHIGQSEKTYFEQMKWVSASVVLSIYLYSFLHPAS